MFSYSSEDRSSNNNASAGSGTSVPNRTPLNTQLPIDTELSSVTRVLTTNRPPGILSEDSDSDTDTDEPEYAYRRYRVDLFASEKSFDQRPIFTRDLLLEMSQLRERALRKQDAIKFLTCDDLNGTNRIIWQESKGNEDDIVIQYATRVDLHKDFQIKMPYQRLPEASHELPYQSSDMLELLHVYNGKNTADPKSEWMPCPFVLKNDLKVTCTLHTIPDAVRHRTAILNNTLSLWLKSNAYRMLHHQIRICAKNSVQIKKIVCIGLGTLYNHRFDSEGLLQHLGVFTIAKALDIYHKTIHPEHTPIKIVAQDPNYSEMDRIALEKIGPITIVSDPQAFLEIDSSTLVVSFCLPFCVPLMQITADLFAPGQGPAGFVCDKLTLDPNRRSYNHRRRDSPAVCRMLDPRYYRSKEFKPEVWVLDPDLREDIYVQVKNRPYWLTRTTLYLRKEIK